MKISIACDHGGYLLKQAIVNYLQENKYDFIDHGCYNEDSVDYPIFAKKVCEDIKNGFSDRGILVCTTGIGMSIYANKFKGIRAALVFNQEMASLTRKHNDSNIICFAGKYISLNDAKECVEIFMREGFSGEEKHVRRINMIKEQES